MGRFSGVPVIEEKPIQPRFSAGAPVEPQAPVQKTSRFAGTPVSDPLIEEPFQEGADLSAPAPAPTAIPRFAPRAAALDPATTLDDDGAVKRISDVGVDLAKGTVGLGQSVVGVAQMLDVTKSIGYLMDKSGEIAGAKPGSTNYRKGLVKTILDDVGYDPTKTNQFLSDVYSDERIDEEAKLEAATGVVETLKALATDPALAIGKAVESAPGMIGIMGAARKVAGKVAVATEKALIKKGITDPRVIAEVVTKATQKWATAAASLAEGGQQAGSSFDELTRQGIDETRNYVASLGSGAITALTSLVMGKMGTKLGLGDVEAGVAGTGGIPARIVKGGVQEGILEEGIQSPQELAWSNWAQKKDIKEGLGKAWAIGATTGFLSGGAFSMAAQQSKEAPPADKPALTKEQAFDNILLANSEQEVVETLASIPEADRTWIKKQFDIVDKGQPSEQLGVKPESIKEAINRNTGVAKEEAGENILNDTEKAELESVFGPAIREETQRDLEETFAPGTIEAKAEEKEAAKATMIEDKEAASFEEQVRTELQTKQATEKKTADKKAAEVKATKDAAAEEAYQADLKEFEAAKTNIPKAELARMRKEADAEMKEYPVQLHMTEIVRDPINLNSFDKSFDRADLESIPGWRGMFTYTGKATADGKAQELGYESADALIQEIKRAGTKTDSLNRIMVRKAQQWQGYEEAAKEAEAGGKNRIAEDELVNGITREAAGNMLAEGDEKVLSHIKEGIEKHGVSMMEDAIRNQEISEVASVPKEMREGVRARIAKLRPQIDTIFDEALKKKEEDSGEPAAGAKEQPELSSLVAPAAGEPVAQDRRMVDEEGERVDRRNDTDTREELEKKVSEMSETEAKEALREARAEALKDELTGLKNKKAFNQRQGVKLIASVDVDNLKWHNDFVSTAMGDEVLRTIGRALASTDIGKADGATHYSGDEFYLESDNSEKLDISIEQAHTYLKENPLTVTTKKGETYEIVIDFSHGIANVSEKSTDSNSTAVTENDHQKEVADGRLKEHKQNRIKEGNKSEGRASLPATAKLVSEGIDSESGTEREDLLSAEVDEAISAVLQSMRRAPLILRERRLKNYNYRMKTRLKGKDALPGAKEVNKFLRKHKNARKLQITFDGLDANGDAMFSFQGGLLTSTTFTAKRSEDGEVNLEGFDKKYRGKIAEFADFIVKINETGEVLTKFERNIYEKEFQDQVDKEVGDGRQEGEKTEDKTRTTGERDRQRGISEDGDRRPMRRDKGRREGPPESDQAEGELAAKEEPAKKPKGPMGKKIAEREDIGRKTASEGGVTYEVQENGLLNTTRETSKERGGVRQLTIFEAKKTEQPKKEEYKKLVENVTIGTLKTGHLKAATAEQAAHLIAPFRKEAQEVMIVVVTDKNDNVLSVINHSKGGVDTNTVYLGALLGAIHATPKAAKFWIAHNHPSGSIDFSQNDNNLNYAFEKAAEGTGVEYKGSLVVSPGGKGSVQEGTVRPLGKIAAARKHNIDITSRKIIGRPVIEESVTSSHDARRILSEKKEKNGVLLLNSGHGALAWVPLTAKEAKTLRTGKVGTGVSKILKAVAEVNSTAMIIKANDLNDGRNVATFAFLHGLRPLDVVYGKDLSSYADEGKMSDLQHKDDKIFYAKGKPSGRSTVESLTKAVDKLLTAKGRKNLNVEVVQTVDDLGLTKPDPTTKGMYRNGKLYLVADNISPAEAWSFVLHEGIHKVKEEKGWSGVFGKKSAAIMKSIDSKIKLNNPAWKAAQKKAIDAGTPDDQVLEETITYFMGNKANQKQGLFRRIANAIRAWAVNIGLTREITEADMVALAEDAIQRRARKAETPLMIPGMIPTPAFGKEQLAPTFFSQLQETVSSKLPGKGTGQSYKQAIESWVKKGEIKAEEVEWSGVLDFLDTQEGKLTQQDVADYLAANNVQVEEVEKGDEDRHPTIEEISEAKEIIASGKEIYAIDSAGRAIKIVEDSGEIAPYIVDNWEDYTVRQGSAEDVRRGGVIPGTKFADYQLPGGENYRELLLTLPDKATIIYTEENVEPIPPGSEEVASQGNLFWYFRTPDNVLQISKKQHPTQQKALEYVIREKAGFAADELAKTYTGGHYSEPNVLAHIRFNERTDADGNKILFIEEVQSDWHQAGRKKGYVGTKALPTFEEWWNKTRSSTDPTWEQLQEDKRYDSARGLYYSQLDEKAEDLVPDAPFKKTWPVLAMKRMIRYAAENGFDKVAWTTGEQQADRYDLSKQIDRIEYKLNDDGTADFEAIGLDQFDSVMSKQNATKGEVADNLGKDVADSMFNDVGIEDESFPEGFKALMEDDLKVGGEGMKGFYDKILPSAVKKFIKRFGGKVGETGIEAGTIEDYTQGITLDQAYEMFDAEESIEGVVDGVFTEILNRDDIARAENLASPRWKEVDRKTTNVHSFDITPDMKRVALQEGLPLFAKGPKQDATTKDIIASMRKQGLLGKDEKPPNIPSGLSSDRDSEWLNKLDPKWRQRWESFMYEWIDRDDPKRLIQNRYGEQPEATNYLRAERLRGKKTAAEVKEFEQAEVNPILEHLANSDLEIVDLENYAMVKHVPERNEQMRRINAKTYLNTIAAIKGGKAAEELRLAIADAAANIEREDRRDAYIDLLNKELSSIAKDDKNYDKLLEQRDNWRDRSVNFAGMTDKEANDILAKWEADPRIKALEKGRKMLAGINKGRLAALVESGEITSEQADIIEGTYKYYVPFHREGFLDGKPSSGKTTGPLGKAIKGATGSQRKVIDILANTVANRQAAISRKHKAMTGQKLFQMVTDNPDPENWWIEEESKTTTHDADGNVIWYPEQQEPPNGIHVKIEGKRYTIKVNHEDPTMMRMLQSIKDVDMGMGTIIQAIAKVTRTLAGLNTTLSPEFIITNLIRDLQTAGINMDDTAATGGQLKLGKNIPAAIKGIFKAERGKESEWGKIYKDFEKNGGKIGWMQSYDTVADLAKQLGNEMKLYQDGHITKKAIRGLSDLLEASNVAIENGVRLATYEYLINTVKVSKSKAAEISSNLTVDFTRRGASGQNLNALYMFANAGIQGNLRMMKAAYRSPKVRKMLAGIVSTGFALHFLALATGGDDDDGIAHYDKVDDSMKERNMIFMMNDGKMIKIPMPYGYNIFFNIGDELAKMVSYSKEGRKYSKTKGMARLATTFMNTFNPMASATLLQTIMPTVGDPVAMVAENKTWFGGDLMPKESPYGIAKPDSERFWKSVSPASKYLAQKVNSLTGGDKVKPGMIDVSPETLDLLVDTYTGSAGRFVKDSLQLPYRIAKDDLPSRKIPFARRFYGEPFEGSTSNLYRERLKKVLTLEAQVKASEGAKRKELRADKFFKLVSAAKAIDKDIKTYSKMRKNREAKGLDVERQNEKIKKLQSKFIKKFEEIEKK